MRRSRGECKRDQEANLPVDPVFGMAENLHRAELTLSERSAHIAEWIRLTEGKIAEGLPAQVAQAVLRDGRKAGPQHQKSGISAAARELGIDRTEAQRGEHLLKRKEIYEWWRPETKAAVGAELVRKRWGDTSDNLSSVFFAADTAARTGIADLLLYCRKHPDVRQAIRAEGGALLAHGEIGGGHGRVDSVNSGDGNSATYALRRLKRDRPELAERVVAVEWLRLNPPNEPIALDAVLVLANQGAPKGNRNAAKDKPENKADNVRFDYGNSTSYTLARLDRDKPELAERVRAGELSAHAAAIDIE
jgi:hypothetical protein